MNSQIYIKNEYFRMSELIAEATKFCEEKGGVWNVYVVGGWNDLTIKRRGRNNIRFHLLTRGVKHHLKTTLFKEVWKGRAALLKCKNIVSVVFATVIPGYLRFRSEQDNLMRVIDYAHHHIRNINIPYTTLYFCNHLIRRKFNTLPQLRKPLLKRQLSPLSS